MSLHVCTLAMSPVVGGPGIHSTCHTVDTYVHLSEERPGSGAPPSDPGHRCRCIRVPRSSSLGISIRNQHRASDNQTMTQLAGNWEEWKKLLWERWIGDRDAYSTLSADLESRCHYRRTKRRVWVRSWRRKNGTVGQISLNTYLFFLISHVLSDIPQTTN